MTIKIGIEISTSFCSEIRRKTVEKTDRKVDIRSALLDVPTKNVGVDRYTKVDQPIRNLRDGYFAPCFLSIIFCSFSVPE